MQMIKPNCRSCTSFKHHSKNRTTPWSSSLSVLVNPIERHPIPNHKLPSPNSLEGVSISQWWPLFVIGVFDFSGHLSLLRVGPSTYEPAYQCRLSNRLSCWWGTFIFPVISCSSSSQIFVEQPHYIWTFIAVGVWMCLVTSRMVIGIP